MSIEDALKILNRLSNKYQLNDLRAAIVNLEEVLAVPKEEKATAITLQTINKFKLIGMKELREGVYDHINDDVDNYLLEFIEYYEKENIN